MCTVLLRLTAGGRWPVLLGAVRDEFVDRAWVSPASHWPGAWSHLVGGRDLTAGGTWLAIDPEQRTVAALLNAGRRDATDDGPRPTRGTLALGILVDGTPPEDLGRYDRFHLLRVSARGGELWSWDGNALLHVDLAPGDHIIVNAGLDTDADPLVPHFAPRLGALASTPEAWIELLAGDGLDPGDDRALIVGKEIDGRAYGSTSAAVVAIGETEVRYDFTATPADPTSWFAVELGSTAAR